jgi:hypothetical protein
MQGRFRSVMERQKALGKLKAKTKMEMRVKSILRLDY